MLHDPNNFVMLEVLLFARSGRRLYHKLLVIGQHVIGTMDVAHEPAHGHHGGARGLEMSLLLPMSGTILLSMRGMVVFKDSAKGVGATVSWFMS